MDLIALARNASKRQGRLTGVGLLAVCALATAGPADAATVSLAGPVEISVTGPAAPGVPIAFSLSTTGDLYVDFPSAGLAGLGSLAVSAQTIYVGPAGPAWPHESAQVWQGSDADPVEVSGDAWLQITDLWDGGDLVLTGAGAIYVRLEQTPVNGEPGGPPAPPGAGLVLGSVPPPEPIVGQAPVSVVLGPSLIRDVSVTAIPPVLGSSGSIVLESAISLVNLSPGDITVSGVDMTTVPLPPALPLLLSAMALTGFAARRR